MMDFSRRPEGGVGDHIIDRAWDKLTYGVAARSKVDGGPFVNQGSICRKVT